MKLIGSTTSPYVRRIRLQLFGQDYEFVNVKIFTEEGQKEVAKYTTTKRIPLLVDGEHVVWDSLLIANYIAKEPLSLDVQKDLVLVNEMTDAGVQLFQLRNFDTDPQDKGIFSQNNLKRIENILDYFEVKELNQWDMLNQWLFCTLDWFDFREVFPWRDHRPKLVEFHTKHKDREDVKSTDPRLSGILFSFFPKGFNF